MAPFFWTTLYINVKKQQLIHLLTAAFKDLHIKNSKNHKKGDIAPSHWLCVRCKQTVRHPWGVSYRWSMVTRRLSGTVIEIFSLEDIGVTTLTFGVTWRHRSRDHSTPHVRFPIGGQWSPSVYMARLIRYSASKISVSRLWPYVVTWCYRSRDHSTPRGVFL